MPRSLRAELLALARQARSIAEELERRAADLGAPRTQEPVRRARSITESPSIDDLRHLSRAEVEERLRHMRQKEIGALLHALGVSTAETKKPKDVLISGILYRLFDYAAGHAMLRGDPEGGAT